jgi:hypothetical protein
MARRSTKQANIVPVGVSPQAGMNLGVSAQEIGDNDLAFALNWYYPKGSKVLTTRPPLLAVCSNANKLSDSIKVLHQFYDGTNAYMVAASGGKLYRMTKAVLESNTPTWTEIGSLSSSTIYPAMRNFNSKLFVADGATAMKYWDGSTFGNVTNSPTQPTALAEIQNRLVCNSADNPDAVFFSEAEIAGTDWNGLGGGNVTLRAGYGDQLPVNAFSLAPGGTLIVSKYDRDQGQGHMRQIILDSGTPTRVSDPILGGYAAQNAFSMVSAHGRLLFFDDDGLHALKASDTSIDFEMDMDFEQFAQRLNGGLGVGHPACRQLYYSPDMDTVFILLADRSNQYLLTKNGFLQWYCSGAKINSMVTIDGILYGGGSNGQLYKIDGQTAQDELSIDSATNISSELHTKKFTGGGRDIRLKRTTAFFNPLRSGTATLGYVKYAGSEGDMNTNVFDDGQRYIGDSGTIELAGSLTTEPEDLIGYSGAMPVAFTVHGGPRDKGIQVAFSTTGRVELHSLNLEFAGPLGG